ncbi:protoporphyrinogen/coproporphyrinogen oxidase [Nocardia sienata]|uniref:protoporphyrinogen/coproporphyrinogen oxidase n=1 Tax=Nocardia sienata TaxID=248552 RepID=UPI000A725A03|nr:NAD(P)/FAD-dependent oxidoreductase [Nocardia sienata]
MTRKQPPATGTQHNESPLRDRHGVVVIGAGPAGLAAAYRLEQAGVDVIVLDPADVVGGKMKSRTVNGFHIDLGPTVVPPTHTHMIPIIKELGMLDTPGGAEVGGSIFGIAQGNGTIVNLDTSNIALAMAKTKLVGLRGKLALGRIGFDVLRARKQVKSPDLSNAAGLDTESAEQYARHLDPALYDNLIDVLLHSQVGAPGSTLSKVDLLRLIYIEVGSPGPTRAFTNGVASYAQTIAKHFAVSLETTVEEVVESAKGVTVTANVRGERKVIEADSVIVTADAHSTAKFLPQLSAFGKSFLEGITYTSMTNVHVGLSAPTKEKAYMALIPASVEPRVLAVVFERNRSDKCVPAGKEMISIYSSDEIAKEYWDADDEVVTKTLLEATENIVPGFRENIEFTFVNRWPRVVSASTPGRYRDLKKFKNSVAHWKRIQFASDYLGNTNMDSATHLGELAAQRIVNSDLLSK